MTDHAWILENLAAYLADGLDAAERERLEQHVNECVPCAAVLANSSALDVTLTGLFVEARPSAALEDRVVQALRNRPSQTFRLPIPAWFAVAAAALVLIGFTGAVMNQMLVDGGMSLSSDAPTDSMGKTLLGYHNKDTLRDAEQLAEESRQRLMMNLDREQNEPEKRVSGLDPSLSITDGTSNGIFSERKKRPPEKESETKSLPPSPTDATGDVKNLNGDDTWSHKPTVVMGGLKDGSVNGTGGGGMVNPGLGYLSSAASVSGSPTSPYINIQRSQGNFSPGQILDEQSAIKKSKDMPQSNMPMSSATENKGVLQLDKLEQLARKGGEKAKNPPPPDKPAEQAGARKIVIRTGEVEYEVPSFDAAVATIARLVKPIKGGFIATVNSDKLANGKVRGSVVVRVPPENLDELILELRTNLSKSGELKNQRIGSQDITKQYTDLESELRAARAMEERLLQIIKNGKGEIKDLLAVEKELGTWRTRIEKIEGELRFFANRVALSTLTIVLYEKEISAPFGIIEREQVQMGVEVEDVDQAYQAAQKAVREAKGRITRAELKQPSQGQFSALLDFEVAPEAAGPLRDRLKQLGSVARFDISRQEETEGGSGKPSDGKIKRSDTRFHVHFYNLTDVPPRETVFVSLACVDVEAALKTLLGRVDKAAGRVVGSNLNSTRGTQSQGELAFQVKTPLADAVLDDVKKAGEVMAQQVRETTNGESTRKKRGFVVKLWSLEAAAARESEEIQLACADVAASYRRMQEAIVKAKGRVRTALLNEQDRRKVTATLDFEIRRADEAAVADALAKAGEVYTRKVSRAADAENVVDTKVHQTVTFLNQANIPPRETYVFAVEVSDVDQTAALLSGLAGKREGRTLEANIARERNGRVTGKLVYDVPMAEVRGLIEQLQAAGTVRVQESAKHPEVPDSPLAVARLDVTLSNKELIVPSDSGFGSNVQRGLADSFKALSLSLRILIIGLCVLLPWALVIWAIYRLVVRLRRRPATPAS